MFCNYHKHSYLTNPIVPDSCVSNEDYAKRAADIGGGIISSVEHSYVGIQYDCFELAKKYDLKFIHGAEFYWVKDRFEKDNTNAHIIVLSKTEHARQEVNNIMSEANISGYYYRPRIDLPLLFTLPRDEVIITTACIAFHKYEDSNDIILRLAEYFKSNFFLEVQYHHTDKQKELNRHILTLADRNSIPIIAGLDSHYIFESTSWERDDYILSKGIKYEDEEGWFLDYPETAIIKDRFTKQGVLSPRQINEAMSNTEICLEVQDYTSKVFVKEIKMPIAQKYKDLTQEEKDRILLDLIWNTWEKEKVTISPEKWDLYVSEIEKEIDTIISTNHSDYFLIGHDFIKLGKEMGGAITPTGRGSSVSNYTNRLLGLTMVDRIASRVKMYPERFMSKTRMLEAKILADYDYNVGTVDIFAKAQEIIVGENHSYPMLAFGTYKPKAAWKLYAKSQNISFDIANNVSSQIESYDLALKRAVDEDEREDIDILDYIDKQYHDIYSKSISYQGIISDWKIAPCGFLLYSGNIRKEIGLVKIKDHLCCLMDGKWAENYKFVKNDLLKVAVTLLIHNIYKRIGIKVHTVEELLAECQPENKVWEIYRKGITLGINQVEQPGTKTRVMEYAPRSISELSSFISAIRPGSKTIYKQFASREPFSYGIKTLDNIIQTPEFPYSFIIYQELEMAVLNYAGIPMTECYEIVKSIAKKRYNDIAKYQDIFFEDFTKKIINDEGISKSEAESITNRVWQIIIDSASYLFNASHAYCVALDSLYGSYLKIYYPLYFYEVFLTLSEEDGNKERVSDGMREAEKFFGIKFPPMRFRQDNRKITADEKTNSITMSLKSIKFLNSDISEELYNLREKEYNTFIDLLYDLEETSINSRQLDILIRLSYFSEFGKIADLLAINEIFKEYIGRKTIKTESVYSKDILKIIQKNGSNVSARTGKELKSYTIHDTRQLLYDFQDYILSKDAPDIPLIDRVAGEIEYSGSVIASGKEEDRNILFIKEVYPIRTKKDNKIFGRKIIYISIGSGVGNSMSILNRYWNKDEPIQAGDLIRCIKWTKSGQYFNMERYEHIFK